MQIGARAPQTPRGLTWLQALPARASTQQAATWPVVAAEGVRGCPLLISFSSRSSKAAALAASHSATAWPSWAQAASRSSSGELPCSWLLVALVIGHRGEPLESVCQEEASQLGLRSPARLM